MSRPVLQPTATHPITIRPTPGRVVVTVHGHAVADTRRALTLEEAAYPARQYIPLADVDAAVLRDSETTTYCPYKGDAAYHSVHVEGAEPEVDLIWTYREPYTAVAEIAGHVAFYPDRAEISVDER